MANPAQRALRLLVKMPPPVNLCPLPDWLPPQLAERLMSDNAIMVADPVRGERGELIILNGVVVTGIGHDIAHPKTDWVKVGTWVAIATFLAAAIGVLLHKWL